MLNLITKLLEKDRLFMAHLPLPPDEAANVRRMYPGAVAKLVDPEVFEFTWENSGIFIDAEELTHYPKVSEEEVQDAVQCPVPHDKIVIHTQVPREGVHNPASYIWHVEATENGYIAPPFVFADQTLSYFGTTLIFDRRYTNPDGSPAFGCRTPASHPVIYDKEELLEHPLHAAALPAHPLPSAGGYRRDRTDCTAESCTRTPRTHAASAPPYRSYCTGSNSADRIAR